MLVEGVDDAVLLLLCACAAVLILVQRWNSRRRTLQHIDPQQQEAVEGARALLHVPGMRIPTCPSFICVLVLIG